MAVSESALTTFDSVSSMLLRSDAEDKLASEVFEVNGTWESEGKRGIEDASEQVKTYLKRDLIVRKIQVLTTRLDWNATDRTPDKDYNFRLKLQHVEKWPVLDVEQDTKLFGDRYIFAKERLSNVDIYAGYRREDQSLSDLPTEIENHFNGDEDIPVLPSDIVGVVNRLAVYYAKMSIKGLIGISKEVQNIGSNIRATVEKTQRDEEFVMNELQKIQAYRFIV